MSTVISVENLCKTYQLGTIGGSTLRADVARWLANLRGKPDPNLQIGQEHQARLRGQEFKALQDVSFEVKQGEILGIIGRNGAGKSTLLKILSRVTAPTSGEVKVKGRIASLLEVGTGFHPELTGRENVFLNGAILGMTKAEIRNKFDEIVDFSGVEQFIDTPVKRYSSGMYVRLAFAVAAHLEPEILIVDEVLAVGDAEFQKKCLGKMKDVSGNEGRTILFVSHNMPAVNQLCTKVVYMDSGRISFDGEVDVGLSKYFNTGNQEATWKNDPTAMTGRKKLFFTKVELLDANGKPNTVLDVRKAFRVKMCYEIPKGLRPVELAVRIFASNGSPVLTTLLSDSISDALDFDKVGSHVAEVAFPPLFLVPGNYSMNVAAHAGVGEIYDLVESILGFTIEDTGTRYSKYGQNHAIGVVMKDLIWSDLKLAGDTGDFEVNPKKAEII